GGLGLFLFGMKMMSDSLENMAGDRMRRVLEMLTNKRLAAVGVGAGVTAVLQSSSATTVMVVGFVNAGLMTLLQATGVIMGANIGTTITAQLIAFKLSDIAPFILFVGMIMTIFVKKRKLIRFGEMILGFGMLFVGLALMSEAMTPLRENEAFRSFLVNFKSPLIGILIGAVFTAIIQSSSASVGILQAMALMGLIGLDSAVYVVLGQNIGTCVTAILAAVGTSTNSKRAAGIHLVFNIAGSTIYLLLLTIFPAIISWIQSLSPDNVTRQIANFHTVFNVSVTILLFPLARQMVKLVSLIIPEKHKPGSAEKKLVYLDERIIQTPAIALAQTMKELDRMGTITRDNYGLALDAFFNRDEMTVHKVTEIEKTVDFLSDNITNHMINFRGADLPENDLKQLGKLHHVIIDLERISDRAENIAEYTMTLIDTKEKMTQKALDELRVISGLTMDVLKMSLEIFKSRDLSDMDKLEAMKREVDILQRRYTENHIQRLQGELCRPHTGVVFTNMLASLERIASHSINIAYSVDLE
ncbi:MAG: Na/Pi cotransporter family protein, partial [Clostridiales bacterium]|nr:Na/Pi cotransporter family protein [Clostridiales bacterium]